MNTLIMIGVLLAGITVIAVVPLRFRIHIHKKGKDDYLSLTWQAIPGIWGVTAEIPFIKVTSNSIWPVIMIMADIKPQAGVPMMKKEEGVTLDWPMIKEIINHLPQIIDKLRAVKKFLLWLMRRMVIRQLNWVTEIGYKEPAGTGILVGCMWMIKSLVYENIQSKVKSISNPPAIRINPDFSAPKLSSEVYCIIDVPCGHIIVGGIKVFRLIRIIRG